MINLPETGQLRPDQLGLALYLAHEGVRLRSTPGGKAGAWEALPAEMRHFWTQLAGIVEADLRGRRGRPQRKGAGWSPSSGGSGASGKRPSGGRDRK